MIIRNYDELKLFLKNKCIENLIEGIDICTQKGNVMDKNYEDKNRILRFDLNGDFTSYPNDELQRSKFIIRKKDNNIEIPNHRHEYMEIFYILEGEIHSNIDGKDILMKKGDICIMDKNVMHSNKPLGKDDLAINMLLTSDVFDTVFMHLLSDNNYISNFIINSFYSNNKIKRYMINSIEKDSFLEGVLINLICEYFSEDIRCQGKITGSLLIIFTELSRMLNKSEDISINKKTSKIEKEILDYLKNEYKETSLLKVADHFHFHPNYLSSLVKKTFGKNFKDLLCDIRMVEAGNLLRTTDIKISTIVESVGYSNEAYFYRQFRKKYNTTPYEYRKEKGIDGIEH